MLKLNVSDIILFEGDSVTDALRNREDFNSLAGYSLEIDKKLKKYNISCINRGVGGNTALQVLERLKEDLEETKPTVFSLLVGVNDTWRKFDSNQIIDAKKTMKDIEEIILLAKKYTDKIILLEPFLLDVSIDKEPFREDLAKRIWLIRDLARKYHLTFVPLNGIFAEACTKKEPSFYSYDGVHPTINGHKLIAKEWLKRIKIEEE